MGRERRDLCWHQRRPDEPEHHAGLPLDQGRDGRHAAGRGVKIYEWSDQIAISNNIADGVWENGVFVQNVDGSGGSRISGTLAEGSILRSMMVYGLACYIFDRSVPGIADNDAGAERSSRMAA